MSKATKQTKHKARVAPKKRRRAHVRAPRGLRPNPGFALFPPLPMEGAIDMCFDMLLMGILRKTGIRDKLKEFVFAKADPKLCVCKGECPCHNETQFGRVTCPEDCPTSGFDVCHRCDCSVSGEIDAEFVEGAD